MPIRKAAKLNGKRREYVRDLVERGEVTAYTKGGSEVAPRLWVDPAEVEPAIKRLCVYVPKAVRSSPGSSVRRRQSRFARLREPPRRPPRRGCPDRRAAPDQS
jgi:hypothetical protein